MKKYVFGTIILAVILLCSIIGNYNLNSFMNKTLSLVDKAEETLNSGEYEKAKTEAENLKSHLEKGDFALRMYIKHEEIDQILASSSRMKAYAKEETKNDYLAECENIRERLKAVVSGEKLSLENIF